MFLNSNLGKKWKHHYHNDEQRKKRNKKKNEARKRKRARISYEPQSPPPVATQTGNKLFLLLICT